MISGETLAQRDDQPVYGILSACAGLCAPDPRLYERVFLLCTGIDFAVFVGKTGYGDYMMIFYYLHYFLLGMLVWEIHQVGRRIGAQLLVYIGMIAAAGAV